MDKTNLINVLEEMGIKPEHIDEILVAVEKKTESPVSIPTGTEMEHLKGQYEMEVDPYKKAAIAARIISKGLE